MFEWGGLPPLDFMAKLAALVPKPGTNLTRFHGVLTLGGLPSNSRYRESVTPLSARQVKPATADVGAEGPDEPDLRAGRRKGSAVRKAVPQRGSSEYLIGPRRWGRPSIDVSVCSACGGSMGIIAESRTTALKI